jgi:hypothetical protein
MLVQRSYFFTKIQLLFAHHICTLFAWLISHQPAVLFSQNKPATSQQYSSLRRNQHQPSATSQPNRLMNHERIIWNAYRCVAARVDPTEQVCYFYFFPFPPMISQNRSFVFFFSTASSRAVR